MNAETQSIGLIGIENARELGGIPAADGLMVRHGVRAHAHGDDSRHRFCACGGVRAKYRGSASSETFPEHGELLQAACNACVTVFGYTRSKGRRFAAPFFLDRKALKWYNDITV